MKTFPNASSGYYPTKFQQTKNDYIKFSIACSDWAEAFDKELRKEMQFLEDFEEPECKLKVKLIKKILGE